MTLLDLARRAPAPTPWAEGDKIPWHEPAFSERMLREHLSQAHDAASRRASGITAHVTWIHDSVLQRRPSRILDLACGPGLYTARLAQLGHTCVGIDFAPAAVAYAREVARAEQLPCEYQLADIRTADYGVAFDLVMLIFGEFNVFQPVDARAILLKSRAALRPGGQLLLEAHTHAAVRSMGEQQRTWQAREHGLFSDAPHLRLDEHGWDDAQQVATTRHYIVDAATAVVTQHAQSVQAYSADDYDALLAECGFTQCATYPALDGGATGGDFCVLLGGVN
jgi:SAM-dependent methyltransferase